MGDHRLYFILFAIFATALIAFPATADQVQNGLPINGCAYETPQGLVEDRDCDGVDDFHDNCKYTPNAGQSDGNRNGIGDACDLLITQINLDPGTEISQGGFATIRIQLINNKEFAIEDVQTRIRNNALDLDISTMVDAIQSEEQRTLDFVVKVPGCAAPGRYELTFTTDHKEGSKVYTQTLYQRILVTKQEGACNQGAAVLANTIIDTLTLQDVELGGRLIYPITITNLNDEAKTYALSLEPISQIGTYRIDPQPTFTVPAGKSGTVYLSVETERFAPLGRNTIRLFVESEGDTQQTLMTLRIIKPVGYSLQRVLATALQLGLIIIILALIVGAGIITYRKVSADDESKPKKKGKKDDKKDDKKGGVEPVKEDDEFQSYY